MKYNQIGVFGAKELKKRRQRVHLTIVRARAKKMHKCVPNTCCISFYMILGQRFSKMRKKFRTFTQCPCRLKNCKNVCKIHVVNRCIYFYEFLIILEKSNYKYLFYSHKKKMINLYFWVFLNLCNKALQLVKYKTTFRIFLVLSSINHDSLPL